MRELILIVHFRPAKACHRLNRSEEALQLFTRSVAIDGRNAKSRYQKALVYFDTARFQVESVSMFFISVDCRKAVGNCGRC